MTSDAAVVAMIGVLESLQIPYMISGSLATNLYGVPRASEDADIVLQIEGSGRLRDIAAQLPAELYLSPQATFETVTASQKYECRLRGSTFRIELFLLTADPYDQNRFARRYYIQTSYGAIWVPTVEDVVVNKLWWAHVARRAKDTEDVRNVVGVQQHNINWTYVNHWCDQHGTRELLEEIRRSIPPELR
jgi:hypothetical protein